MPNALASRSAVSAVTPGLPADKALDTRTRNARLFFYKFTQAYTCTTAAFVDEFEPVASMMRRSAAVIFKEAH